MAALNIRLKATRRYIKECRKATLTYNWKEIDKLIDFLADNGYDCIQTDEGVLGSGNWICVKWEAPSDEDVKQIVIREIPLDSQTSTHIIYQFRNLPQKYAEELASAMDVEE